MKSVLSALSKEAQHLRDDPDASLGTSLGTDIITRRVIEDVLRWRNHIREDIQNGKTPRAIALWLMANVARDYVASGELHIYRGYLSMSGTALKSVLIYCYDELTKIGQMTAEERSAALKAIN